MRDAKVNNVALFVDIGNLYYCVNRRYPEAKLDYQKLLTRAKTYGNLIRAFAYGSQVNEEAVNFITCLKAIGYDTKYKRPKVITTPEKGDVMIRANWNVGITIDVVNLVRSEEHTSELQSHSDLVCRLLLEKKKKKKKEKKKIIKKK